MGFSAAELATYRDATVPDLIGDDTRLIFVGINPGLWTAATGTHFARPGNRFWPALARAGIIERPFPHTGGLADADVEHLWRRGVGITNLVARATARADEVGADELSAGAERLLALAEEIRPVVVAVAGITAYRQAFRRRVATAGPQEERLGPAELWVVPNPSGLNAHETIDSLAEWYRRAAVAAGVLGEDDQEAR